MTFMVQIKHKHALIKTHSIECQRKMEHVCVDGSAPARLDTLDLL